MQPEPVIRSLTIRNLLSFGGEVSVIRSLTIRNLLSFGGEATTIDLQHLNVLIGPNGSGKSNLIEVLGLLQNAPKELATAISNGGPIDEWLWKGATKTP